MIERVTHEATASLRDPGLSASRRADRIRELARQTLDFDILSRLTLGRYWADLPDAKREEFRREYEQHMLNTLVQVSDTYGGQDLSVISDRTERDGDHTVRASVFEKLNNGAHDEVAKVDLRLRPTEHGWKLIDVNINGLSLLGVFRAQFQSLIANSGGIDPVIKMMHDKNASAAAAAGAAAAATTSPSNGPTPPTTRATMTTTGK